VQGPPLSSATLVNPGFEDLTGSTTLFNQDVPGWSDYDGAVGSGAGWFNKTVIDETHPAWATTPWSGNGVGMLAVYDTGQDEAWMFQSLGSVGAADVGKTFIMTADFAFRQGGTRWTDSDMTVAFMSGITDTGTYGTVLGTAGVRNFVTDINGTVPIPFESRTATFTPLAEDVGTEVFAVLAIQQYDAGGSTGARQGIVDNVTLVPEPSALALIALAGLGMMRRRR